MGPTSYNKMELQPEETAVEMVNWEALYMEL